jgi:transcriptional regulator with XRE-family HTH domain
MKIEPSYLIHRIGPKIRDLRKEKGILLSDVSDATGISSPMVSKIENGRVVPTLPSLLSLLNVLEVAPEVFFAEINVEPEFSGFIHLKKDDYKHYVKEETAIGFYYRSILERTLDGFSFQVSHITLQPGNTRPKVSTDAFELLYVIKGEMHFYLNDESVLVKEGESLFFDGNIPHVPLNKTDEEVTYVVTYFFGNK